MYKGLFIIESSLEKHISPVFYPVFGYPDLGGRLFFEKAVKGFREVLFESIGDPKKADFLVVPYSYEKIKENGGYFEKVRELGRKHRKKVLLFSIGDFGDQIDFPDSVVFRTSVYKFEKKDSEVVVPPFVEDLKESGEIKPRRRRSVPTVGFAGWSRFRNPSEWLRSDIKNDLLHFRAIFGSNENILAKQKGIYFRKKAIKELKNSKLVRTNFIERKSYSGHKKTVTEDPEKLRREYIENIGKSDLILCPKGDGNYSARFYETLSLGRAPLLIDTEMILPLENILDYSKYIFRVNWKDLERVDQIVYSKYSDLTESQFEEMQSNARASFENILNPSSFWKFVFSPKNRFLEKYL